MGCSLSGVCNELLDFQRQVGFRLPLKAISFGCSGFESSWRYWGLVDENPQLDVSWLNEPAYDKGWGSYRKFSRPTDSICIYSILPSNVNLWSCSLCVQQYFSELLFDMGDRLWTQLTPFSMIARWEVSLTHLCWFIASFASYWTDANEFNDAQFMLCLREPVRKYLRRPSEVSLKPGKTAFTQTIVMI